jgi:flagellar biosynthesis chaperone FliJ
MNFIYTALTNYFKKNKPRKKLETLEHLNDELHNVTNSNREAEILNNDLDNFVFKYKELEQVILDECEEGSSVFMNYKSGFDYISNLKYRITELNKKLAHQAKIVEDIEKFTDVIFSTDKEIFQKMTIEEHNKAVDVKHRITLTLLKFFQIFIFIFSAYWAATLAVKSITHFDLSPPKMPFSIVPNVVTKTTKNIESVTNPGITPDQS